MQIDTGPRHHEAQDIEVEDPAGTLMEGQGKGGAALHCESAFHRLDISSVLGSRLKLVLVFMASFAWAELHVGLLRELCKKLLTRHIGQIRALRTHAPDRQTAPVATMTA